MLQKSRLQALLRNFYNAKRSVWQFYYIMFRNCQYSIYPIVSMHIEYFDMQVLGFTQPLLSERLGKCTMLIEPFLFQQLCCLQCYKLFSHDCFILGFSLCSFCLLAFSHTRFLINVGQSQLSYLLLYQQQYSHWCIVIPPYLFLLHYDK